MGACSSSWTKAIDNRSTAVIKLKFSRKVCGACACRVVCAGSNAQCSLMTFRTRDQHLALTASRQRQREPVFTALYASPASVEATISQAIRGFGLRRAR